MEPRSLIARLLPPTRQGMATHLAWLAREFGRTDLAPLSPEDVVSLGETLRTVHADPGETVLSPDDPAGVAYIVEAGEVELSLRQHGHRTVVAVQRAGGVFGDVPLLCGMSFPYVAVAKTDTTLLELRQDSLVELLQRRPAIALRWLSTLVRRLEYANRRIASLTAGDLRSRVVALLAEELSGGVSTAAVELTQAQIAALLGATRQSVNRVLGGLAKEGLVRQSYGVIEILDAPRLLEATGLDAVIGSTC